jgi:hypothetical protein
LPRFNLVDPGLGSTLGETPIFLDDVTLDSWIVIEDSGRISMTMDRFSIPNRFDGVLQETIMFLDSSGYMQKLCSIQIRRL